jgi:predicted Zn-dependent protease
MWIMTPRTWLVLTFVVLLPACATNPVTGKRQLTLVSEAQEIELGRQAAEQVEQSIGLVDDAPLQAYVNRVGTALAAESERPRLPWAFHVLDDPTPNAFALPGGFIFVTRGLMELMDSEAELASVLGHEIGHVTARHSVTQISRQQLAHLGLGLGGILVPELQRVEQALGAGLQLLFLKHGRDAERQADELGFDYARAEGYDASQIADVFAALERIGDRENQSALPSWLATHPAPEERIQAANQRVAQLGPPPPNRRTGRTEYLEHIDGLVYGHDPRNGFFRDGVFYHPQLRFRFAVPQEWQARNLARAVVASSPQGDAATQLTLAGATAPAEAARRFAAQTGVQPRRVWPETVHGNPAVVTEFQAHTQQGTLAGYAAYVGYRGRTYQLIAYAAADAFSRRRETLMGIVMSFAPVTDAGILNVQPRRIDIVKVPRTLSLREFEEAYPSSVPLDTLALLNQLPAPTSSVPSGALVKRVVGQDPSRPQHLSPG